MAFVWFLSTVNSAVSIKVSWVCKLFATNSTFKRFLSRMNSSVDTQWLVAIKTLSTFSTLVFTAVNIQMKSQITLSSKTFLTLTAWIQLSCSMYLFVYFQMSFCCKPFVTHCTQIRSWLAIKWVFSDIITISFNIRVKGSLSCIIYTLKSTFAEQAILKFLQTVLSLLSWSSSLLWLSSHCSVVKYSKYSCKLRHSVKHKCKLKNTTISKCHKWECCMDV